MKKHAILLILFLYCLSLLSQKPVITLSFEVYDNDTQIEFDSIFIENVTAGCDTTIKVAGSDFSVFYSTGIAEGMNQNDFLISRISPNPTYSNATFNLTSFKNETVNIACYDLFGRQEFGNDFVIGPGIHEFHYIPGNSIFSLISVKTQSSKRTFKIVNNNIHNGFRTVIEYAGMKSNAAIHKASFAHKDFIYRKDDLMKFIVYAETLEGFTGSDFIFDSPEVNKIYTFNITKGVYCRSEPVVNYGNKAYKTVKIGDLCWFRENLNVGNVMVEGEFDMNNDSIIEKYCYADEMSNCDVFGALYQWDEAMGYRQNSGATGICPDTAGWHIPKTEEFEKLAQELGGFNIAGGHLKSTSIWNEPNYAADNQSGFTALPGGLRCTLTGEVYFGGQYSEAYFMSSDCDITGQIIDIYLLRYDNQFLSAYEFANHNGYSVRCVKVE